MLAAIAGQQTNDAGYIGKKVYSRKTKGERQQRGAVTNTSICRLDGCGGCRLHVKWADGHYTYVCAKGVRDRPNGDLEIA